MSREYPTHESFQNPFKLNGAVHANESANGILNGTTKPKPRKANTIDLTGKLKMKDQYYFATGGFADIWKGEWLDEETGKQRLVAIKVLRTAWNDPQYMKKLEDRLDREARVWSQLSHPHIMPFLGTCYDPDRRNAPSLVSPYYENGDINTFLRKHPDENRLLSMVQIAAALYYLHDLCPPVVHGDIKGSNILINDEKDAILSDFGISRVLQTSGFTTKSVAGTARWMAYELLFANDDEEDVALPVTTASDVWAFAMTNLEVFTGKPPYAEYRHDSAVLIRISKGYRPINPRSPQIPEPLWTLLENCWKTLPGGRPSIRKVALALDLMYACAEAQFRDEDLDLVLASHDTEKPPRSGTKSPVVRPYSLPNGPYICKWGKECSSESFESLKDCASHECDVLFSLRHPLARNPKRGSTVDEAPHKKPEFYA